MTGPTPSGRLRPAVPPTPIAIVGMSAVMPDAPNAAAFWDNIKGGRYSITDVPPERWDPALYYDADPKAPGKSYSAIGGWVRDFEWDPFAWKLPIPPRVGEQFDEGQKWSVALARTALMDFGWPEKPMDTERCAVIIGSAIGGEKHYATNMRIQFPEFERELRAAPSFASLPEGVRESVIAEAHKSFDMLTPDITEDTMPGELANIMAGRVANLFNLRGPNFTTDAACASGLAALSAAANGLAVGDFDSAIAGGIDRNMGIAAFVKFCKIGALSATGTRPFDAGADGFVMGEGGALFVLKRLADAEREGDHIYAVILGVAGSSDGKGKGITAPNPVGQKLAVERAWSRAGVDPATIGLIEAHGTSTRVGDVGEAQALTEVLLAAGAKPGTIALGSVKSNIGHLKAAAGAAGLFKAAKSLSDQVQPPSLHFQTPNPNIDWANTPLKVNTELREWAAPASGVRTAGVSAFGFGGANFHVALEEYVPGRHRDDERSRSFAGADIPATAVTSATSAGGPAAAKAPLRGAMVVGAADDTALAARLEQVARDAVSLAAVAPAAPARADLAAPVRVAIDYADAADLSDKATKAREALLSGQPVRWRPLRTRGVFLGRGPAKKVAFLFTGQGSQYVNMLKGLRDSEPVVAETFAEADAIMTPLLGRPLSEFVFGDDSDPAEKARLTQQLLQTEITQPAVLTADAALMALLGEYGMRPDMVMGHSLGEYAALVAAGSLTVPAALEAVSARGREMAGISVDDNGVLAAVMAPLEEVQRIVDTADGYVVVANVNSSRQAVIGGATPAVEKAIERIAAAGGTAVQLPVSHAFHTSIVAPASAPLRDQLRRLNVQPPRIPLIANVHGGFYPTVPGCQEEIIELLGRQVAEPVQFVKGLETLYDSGARVFVEVGPKKALHGFAEDVLGKHDDVTVLFTNHPKFGDAVSLNQALCGLYAAGLGTAVDDVKSDDVKSVAPQVVSAAQPVQSAPATAPAGLPRPPVASAQAAPVPGSDRFHDIGVFIADIVDRGRQLFGAPAPSSNGHAPTSAPVVISGASLGLPGTDRVFDDGNVARILSGQQFIDAIPPRLRKRILDKNITRLVKSEDGSASWLTLSNESEIIKLAGRAGALDAVTEFGIDPDRDAALDEVTRLAIGAGIDALRDAGIPLVLRYRTTSIGTELPDRWMLPEELRDGTGIVFASAFPGLGSFADELERYFVHAGRLHEIDSLVAVRARVIDGDAAAADLDSRIRELRSALEAEPYVFDRRFLFRVLSMGHSQFAEIIGARGPNTQVNAACASATQAIGVAEDWIKTGRCRRVLVISADDISHDHLLEWMGSGFLATGAAATDERVEDAALPFDNRRHGMLIGMGAAAFVLESAEACRERGIAPLCEVLATVMANSAFHGTRLDIDHIAQVMEGLVAAAEKEHGIRRADIASHAMFMSHETYTPARGGSAAAEINALRKVFGAAADSVVVTNTKGFTGHAMGAGIEDAVAVKALETGIMPPIPNFRDVDPSLGALNLSRGGEYPLEYALRLAAGFGSQICMSLVRHVPSPTGVRPRPDQLGFQYRVADETVWRNWLRRISGQDDPALEVVTRRLRVVDPGLAGRRPVAAPAAVMPAPVAVSAPAPVTAPPAPVVPAGVAVAAPVAVAAAPSAAEPAGDDVLERVLAIVAETTGYPPEMLDPELDLEADLGVDTVKQAEVFAAVRAAFEIARDDNLQLRDYPTLSAVVGFVRERAALPAAVAAPAAPSIPAQAAPVEGAPAAATNDDVLERVLAIVAETTGYPPEMLDPELDLEADLGVDTVKQAEVFAAVRAAFEIARDDNLQLRDYPTLSAVVGFVRERAALPAAVAAPAALSIPAQAAPVEGAPAAATNDDVLERVLAIVAETTGYPPEMLDPELDLEADLGVDTVKQAEVFAAVRAAFEIARDDNLQLRDYPTLSAVVGFVRERAALPAAVAAPAALSIPAQAAPVEGAPAAATNDDVLERVLAIVAETTGYPPEMLDPELDLEADLGVDTVKQAEVFAAVRAAFEIARDDNLQLRDYPTLSAVVGFVRERAQLTGAAAPAVTPEAAAPAATAAAAAPELTGFPAPALGSLDAANAIVRRVPVPVLRPALAQCRATGVVLDGDARVVLAADLGGVGDALAKRLDKLGVTVLRLDPAAGAEAISERLDGWLADGPITGVYWLPALDEEGPVDAMDHASWREALRVRVKNLYATMRRLNAGAPFLVTGTRLGGRHGYDPAGATSPLGGAVTGFAKAYKREQPDALVKAVDFAASRRTARLADVLVDETLRDPGCVEVGMDDVGAKASAGDGGRPTFRWGVGLHEQPAADGNPGMDLNPGSVYVITGAAGSIVSAISADLARSGGGGVFHLLDLTPAPDPDDTDLRQFFTDKEGLKTSLIARMKADGTKLTPVMVEKELARIERLAMAEAAIAAVTQAGGTAHYHCVDLTDAEAVEQVMAGVAKDHGHVDVVLLAAGVEISRLLEQKEPREYDLVFGVKSDGWFNVLHGLADTPVGATVAFSSVAGRFGNVGQTDYSAANDLLCKLTSNLRRTRPDVRGIVIDWTAWGGIGMATRGSIPAVMAAAGIDMLPAEAGIATIRRELTAGGTRGEIVVAGRLGMMGAEFDETGGLDPATVDLSSAGPMIGRITGMGILTGLSAEVDLDPTVQPFLNHHRIDGTAVLPGVMGIEGFAELAGLLLAGWSVSGVEDVEFVEPVKFYRDEPRTLHLSAILRDGDPAGGDLVADCTLTASRTLVTSPEPVVTEHFRARVRLTAKPAPAEKGEAAPKAAEVTTTTDELYQVYFHGPAYQVLGRAWRTDGAVAGELSADLPDNHVPPDKPLAAKPRLIELCFQTAGLLGLATEGALGLPQAIGRVLFPAYPASGTREPAGLVAVATPRGDDLFDVRVVDSKARTVLRLEGYRTVTFPAPVAAQRLEPLRRAVGS